MSKPAKPPAAAAVPVEPPFEEALTKLEGIVEAMEADDLPLELLLARYEEGRALAEICHARLTAAETRIQQLEKNAAGELVTQPFHPAADRSAPEA